MSPLATRPKGVDKAAVLSPLQTQGMKVLPYLDNWLICVPSQTQVSHDTVRLLWHAASLGWKVKLDKRCLESSQTMAFIEVALNSLVMTACPSALQVETYVRGVATPPWGCGHCLEHLWRGRGGHPCFRGVNPLSPVVLPNRGDQPLKPRVHWPVQIRPTTWGTHSSTSLNYFALRLSCARIRSTICRQIRRALHSIEF